MSTTPPFSELPDIDFDFEPDEAIETVQADDLSVPVDPGTALDFAQPLPDIYSLLPMPHIELTASEKETVQKYQLGRIILGPVAEAVMQCPPPITQGEIDAMAPATVTSLIEKLKICPFRTTCPFLQQDKAPHNSPCPLETNYLTERFIRWTAEMGKTPHDINETERVNISTLVTLDMHERRHLSILSEAEAARGVDLSLKETDTHGNPIAWEKVIHISQQSLAGLRAERKQILRSFELTPEMKTKKAKYEGGTKGADLSSIQSGRAAQLSKALMYDAD